MTKEESIIKNSILMEYTCTFYFYVEFHNEQPEGPLKSSFHHQLVRKIPNINIMGDDFLYISIAVFICLFPKWLKDQEHTFVVFYFQLKTVFFS